MTTKDIEDLIERLRSHEETALMRPDKFNRLDVVLDCVEAANVLEELLESGILEI